MQARPEGLVTGTTGAFVGRLYSSTAASTTITNGTGAQTYDVTYTLPANSLLLAGDTLRIRGLVECTAANAAETFTVVVRVGGTAIFNSGDVDVAANDLCSFDLIFSARAAAGATVACVASGGGGWNTAAQNMVSGGLTATNFATNGALVVDVQITYSAAGGNSSNLAQLVIDAG
ncbi:MAG: hypothetical protein ABII82_07045 [Verrucomicrobiota bacterium]